LAGVGVTILIRLAEGQQQLLYLLVQASQQQKLPLTRNVDNITITNLSRYLSLLSLYLKVAPKQESNPKCVQYQNTKARID
jgi:hypothetical protein